MTPTIADIVEYVAERYGVTSDDLTGPRRARRLSEPRQRAYALAREVTGRSLPAIAAAFGGRDHTTILHGIRADKARRTPGTDAELIFSAEATALRCGPVFRTSRRPAAGFRSVRAGTGQ